MRKYCFLCIVGLLAAFAACQRDPEIPAPSTGGGTGTHPYEIKQIPGFINAQVPVDNPMTQEGVELGRKLFYDPVLSRTYTLSCAGCHNPDFGFTNNGNTLSQGVGGQFGTRNSMPLFNLAFHLPRNGAAGGFFWDGNAPDLESQAVDPIKNPIEMDLPLAEAVSRLNQHPTYPGLFKQAFGEETISEALLGKAIAQFMRSIQSYTSPFDLGLANDSARRGYEFFRNLEPEGDCIHCHTDVGNFGPAPGEEFKNNGLDANPAQGRAAVTGLANDIGKFKVPSLRNLKLTAPYMHDGRFKTLEEVVNFYDTGFHYSPTLDPNMSKHLDGNNKPIPRFTPAQKADLVAFLNSLTDTLFIRNPKYTHP